MLMAKYFNSMLRKHNLIITLLHKTNIFTTPPHENSYATMNITTVSIFHEKKRI